MSRATTTGVVLDVRGDDVDARRESSPRATSYAPDGSATREDASSAELSRPRSNRAPSTTRAGRLWDTMLDPDATRRRDAHFARANEVGHHRAYDYSSWTDTTFAVGLRARAVNNFRWPWALVNGVTIVWCALARNVDALDWDLTAFERGYALIFSLLAFLLVFRVNRAAVRWWDCRTAWGAIVLGGRLLADDAIASVRDVYPAHVDDLARWFVAFAVATKCHLRRETRIDPASLAGVVDDGELDAMRTRATHAPLYCASRMREAVTRMTREPDPNAPRPSEEWRDRVRWERARMHWSLAAALNARMTSRIDALVGHCGAQERIRATRLPIVYVTHLRTFLMGYLLSLPFVFVRDWGWGTVPAVACVSFALLGVEGAAHECENPFRCVLHPRPPSPSGSTFDRVPFQLTDDHILYGTALVSANHANHLGMDVYCETVNKEMCEYLRLWREEKLDSKEGGGDGR